MFESLTEPTRRTVITQPALALALHVGMVALAVRASSPGPMSTVRMTVVPPVIYIPESRQPNIQVATVPGGGGIVPGTSIPPIDVTLPGSVEARTVSGTPLRDPRGLIRNTVSQLRGQGLSRDSALYQEADLSDSPEVVEFPRPGYPSALQAAGIEGSVLVTYVVDTAGHVETGSVTIVSSDRPEMAESVRVALRTALFRPGRIRGQAVRTLVRQTIRFATTME